MWSTKARYVVYEIIYLSNSIQDCFDSNWTFNNVGWFFDEALLIV